MNPGPPPRLIEFIRAGSRFLVAGHKEPDGDCVGSQLALVSFLGRLGKSAQACSAGPFKRPEVLGYAAAFTAQPVIQPQADYRVLVVDCSQTDRLGDLAPFLLGLPAATIDHHAAGTPFGDVAWINPSAPSVTFMVQELIEAMGETPTAAEAALLFFGLCTDTGFFRHVDRRGAAVFEAASRLVAAGADPKATFQLMSGGKSLGSRLLMGRILARTESHFSGRLLLSTETFEDTEQFGLQGRDSDMIYQLLQAVTGAEAVALIRQETPDSCTVGLRSRAEVDVAAVAGRFGGGGHRQAAGLSASGSIASIRARLLEVFGEIFL